MQKPLLAAIVLGSNRANVRTVRRDLGGFGAPGAQHSCGRTKDPVAPARVTHKLRAVVCEPFLLGAAVPSVDISKLRSPPIASLEPTPKRAYSRIKPESDCRQKGASRSKFADRFC